MATYTWPAGRAWTPQTMTWGVRHNARTSTSPLNGATQTVTLPGSRWVATLSFPAQEMPERQALLALLLKTGADNVLQLGDLAAPRPRGTCNLTGVTASAAAQFVQALTLNGCGTSKTLLAGDKIGVGGQLLMVTDDATSSAGGVMAITVRQMLRAAVTGGAAVTLDAPAALWRLEQPDLAAQWTPGGIGAPLSFDLIEVFA